MEKSDEELAKKLIKDYYNNKYSNINKKIAELEDEKKRYYDITSNEFILTNY